MKYQTLAQLLVIILLSITNARFFLFKKVKGDSLAILPLIAIFISVFNIIAFGLSSLECITLILSIFVWIWNVRASLRLFSGLVIDHYSAGFKVISFINLLLVITLSVFVIYLRPSKDAKKKFNVSVKTEIYTGNLTDGFELISNPVQEKDLIIYTITKNPDPVKPVKEKKEKVKKEKKSKIKKSAAEIVLTDETEITAETENIEENSNYVDVIIPDSETENNAESQANLENAEETAEVIAKETQPKLPGKMILFIPPKNADFETYSRTLYKLAYDGYTVYCADFFTSDATWFNKFCDLKFLKTGLFKIQKFQSEEKYINHLKSKEIFINAEMVNFVKIVNPAPEDLVVLVTEQDVCNALQNTSEELPELVDLTYDFFQEDAAYTSCGWGPVENTNPQIAFHLGLKPERSGYLSSHLASVLEKHINQFNGL